MAADSNSGIVTRGYLEATVIFEYSGQGEDELSLGVGDVVKDVVQLNDIWCSGVIRGRRGSFPRNFVKLLEKTKPASSSLSSIDKPHGKRKPDKSQVKHGFHSTQAKATKLMSTSSMKAKQVTTPSLVSPVASSSSSTSTLSQQQSGFIVGSPVKGKEVRHSSSPQSSNVCTPSVIQQGDLTKTQFSGAPGPSNISARIREKATVKVAYEAIDEDEISVQVGDVVDVIDKVTEDEGWWKVQLGKKEGVLPEIFLDLATTSDLTIPSSEEGPTDWLTLVPPGDEKTDTVASAGFHTCNTETSTSTFPNHQQIAITQTANEMQSVINFPSELIGRALLLTPRIASHINLVAKLHNVTVSADNASQVILSGSPQGVAYVHNEINTLASQAKRDIKAHCMLIPILFSHQARDVITIIRQRCDIEISLVATSGLFPPILDLIQASHQIQLLQKVQVKNYLIPLVPVSELYTWSFINKHSVSEPLPASVNQLLNNRYSLQFGGQEQFQFNGVSYVADLSTMTLVDTLSGETVTLCKEPLSPYWLFAQDQQRDFLNFVQSDSDAIECMYCYGGSSVTLSGVNHLIEFTSMHQLNLKTAKTSLIKRYPPPASSVLPDYNCHLVLIGSPDSLNETTKEIMKQLDALCALTEFTCKLPGVSQHWLDVIAVHVFNVFRQFCVKVGNLQVNNGVLMAQLQGERDYCEKVKVHVKEQLLDLLQSAVTQESGVQYSPSINFPPEWEPQQSDVELKPVQRNSQEWNSIVEKVNKTLPAAGLIQIDRVQNRQLWEKYALEKSHMDNRNNGLVNEKLLFHGTRKNDPQSVAQSLRGIDFRCSRRDHRLLWGIGAYFAVNANYSHHYSHNNHQLHAWQMIIVKVLTGHSCSYRNPNPSLTRPPPLFAGSNLLYDTVCGSSGGSDIYVVYDQDRAYPAYIISYHLPTNPVS